jgi:hypothetical protein
MTPLPTDDCPGAPSTLFKVGDTAVVDFTGLGALKILPEVSPKPVSALAQAYDNDQLHILAGPACGTWRQSGVWYWYVEHDGVKGWVAEAAADDRWLCPLSNSECS